MRAVPTLAFLLLVAAPAAPAGPPSVDERAAAAMHAMFGDSVAVTRVLLPLARADQDVVARASEARWSHDTIVVFTAAAHGRVTGYGFLDDVKGKLQLITMLTGLLPGGEVRDVEILVYRESYGGEVANESFRRQFRGLRREGDIRPGATIRSISGATISARAVTLGVRKAAATYRLLGERLPR